ncbi:histidine kinase [Ginsengibacter hankyongi]|uniref:histidine kinase n=1 Tax=Ginsengibacter hankyongi TaxID=2607284 RepID=A0A5J5INU9_9BACT|nr:CHASE3 domain-containing protein [Ginsengibacter hankyongi]KAA9042198.1 histidine kinase [Ginsengibacter hankyongi]
MIKNLVDKIADHTRWGYLTAFIILLISYIVSFVSAQHLMKQSALVNHSNEVIHSVENVVGYVTRGESAVRGYIITQNKDLLIRYYKSRNNADSALKKVKALTIDNPVQQKNMDSLNVLINDKFLWMDSTLSIFDNTHSITSEILNKRTEGTNKMQKVELFTKQIQREEKNLFYKRNNQLAKYSDLIKGFTIISLIVAILLTIYSIITFNKENKAKLEASEKAAAYHKQLELRIEELAALNIELIELRNIEKFAATGRISRTIAHEVRNPLTNINLATEQLQNEVPANDDVNLLLQMISRNSNRINQLINDLLDSTKTSELQYTKTSINTVLNESLELATDRIGLKHIKVIKNFDKDICPVFIDPEKIKIAFLNIIVNAIEAMDDYGTLSLFTESKSQFCNVKISDTGRGLSKEDLARLFEPYFTTKEKGKGLGLTNTQNIILAHDAHINVESEPGNGTSFTISFAFA